MACHSDWLILIIDNTFWVIQDYSLIVLIHDKTNISQCHSYSALAWCSLKIAGHMIKTFIGSYELEHLLMNVAGLKAFVNAPIMSCPNMVHIWMFYILKKWLSYGWRFSWHLVHFFRLGPWDWNPVAGIWVVSVPAPRSTIFCIGSKNNYFAFSVRLVFYAPHTWFETNHCSFPLNWPLGPFHFIEYYRPVISVPKCSLLNTFELRLNTRLNPVTTQLLDPHRPPSIQESHFDLAKDTKILIHGFTDRWDWAWWRVREKNRLCNCQFYFRSLSFPAWLKFHWRRKK